MCRPKAVAVPFRTLHLRRTTTNLTYEIVLTLVLGGRNGDCTSLGDFFYRLLLKQLYNMKNILLINLLPDLIYYPYELVSNI